MTMKYMIKCLFVLVCLLLFASSQVFGATGKQIGTTGAMELLIPVGGHSTALSGANIASVEGIDAMYWNPAGACILDSRAEAMFSYQNYIADIYVSYLAAITNIGSIGNIGLSVKALNFGEIMETTTENPDGTGLTFSPNYITLSAHFSRKFTDRIHFGCNAKIISEKIMSTSANGFAVDLGLQYINESGLRLGFVLTNFGGNMQFSGPDLELRQQVEGTEYGSELTSMGVPTMKVGLPTQLKIGAGYDLKIDDMNAVSLSGAFVNNASAYSTFTGGLEYAFKDMVFIRAAYSAAYMEGIEGEYKGFVTQEENYLWGPSFGGGVKLGVGTNMSLMVDYAYQITEFFDNVQWFSFSFSM